MLLSTSRIENTLRPVRGKATLSTCKEWQLQNALFSTSLILAKKKCPKRQAFLKEVLNVCPAP